MRVKLADSLFEVGKLRCEITGMIYNAFVSQMHIITEKDLQHIMFHIVSKTLLVNQILMTPISAVFMF